MGKNDVEYKKEGRDDGDEKHEGEKRPIKVLSIRDLAKQVKESKDLIIRRRTCLIGGARLPS